MIRLLKIEFAKLKSYWPFWLLLGLYVAMMLGLSLWVPSFLEWWSEQGANFQGVLPSTMPIFDFDEIWQNITFLGRFFFPILAFLVIIIFNNELTYNTLKQNIIDGMSRKEWLASKVLVLLAIVVIATLLQLFSGFYLGFNHSSVQGSEYIMKNIAFIPAYAIQLTFFLSLAMFITILVRKAILSFGILLLYYWPVEQLIRYFLPDALEPLHAFFPIKALLNVIENPFPKYIFMDVNIGISPQAVLIALVYIFILWLGSYLIIKKRDL